MPCGRCRHNKLIGAFTHERTDNTDDNGDHCTGTQLSCADIPQLPGCFGVQAEWVFLTCAEQARVDFRIHSANEHGELATSYRESSLNYFFEQPYLPVEDASPLSEFKRTCSAVLCQAAPDDWTLTVHISSRDKAHVRIRVPPQQARGLPDGSMLLSNASFVSASGRVERTSCSNGPFHIMAHKNSDCAALILESRSPPCGLEAIALDANGCPPQIILASNLPGLLGSSRYRDMCDPTI